ncbi:biotin/lipoyl-containing protein, partial [Streptomyces sp. NPDC050523]|uniref:biotin/lipoyl-containing protein n=1 Tax=Streptomyces sp. NPDC050523 TaxID=3365622 RepID=UPI0037AE45E5
VVTDPAFAPELTGSTEPFTVHTRWIETEFVNTIPAYAATPGGDDEPDGRETAVVEVGGRRIEVTVPLSLGLSRARTAAGGTGRIARRSGARARKTGSAVSGDTLAAPMQGTITKVAAEEGARVAEGDLVVVLEAMKMEQPINAHKAGTVVGLKARVGASLTADAAICTIRG